MSKQLSRPQIVLRNGKPHAVILGIRQFAKLLERIEDTEDLREIRKLRKRKQRCKTLEQYAAKHH